MPRTLPRLAATVVLIVSESVITVRLTDQEGVRPPVVSARRYAGPAGTRQWEARTRFVDAYGNVHSVERERSSFSVSLHHSRE
jgi:hypothetical protein